MALLTIWMEQNMERLYCKFYCLLTITEISRFIFSYQSTNMAFITSELCLVIISEDHVYSGFCVHGGSGAHNCRLDVSLLVIVSFVHHLTMDVMGKRE